MTSRYFLPATIAASLSLISCAGPVEENVAGSEPAEEAPLPAPSTIMGEWRVAGVDGQAIDLPHAMTVSIDNDTVQLVSQCLTPRWSYEYAGGALITTSTPEPVCERERYDEEVAAIAAFDAAEKVDRTPENGLRLSGGGHTVTLFSQ